MQFHRFWFYVVFKIISWCRSSMNAITGLKVRTYLHASVCVLMCELVWVCVCGCIENKELKDAENNVPS